MAKTKKKKQKDFYDKYINDSMTKKVVVFDIDVSLKEIAKQMAKQSISCVVIVDKKSPKKPRGIITERDIVKIIAKSNNDLKSIKAKDFMSKPVKCVHEKEMLVPIAKLMRNNKSRRFPVIDNKGNMIGLITQTDVLDGMIQLVKHLNWNLVDKLLTIRSALDQYKEELKMHNII